MTGKILVVDPIATNRIVLKAKLSVAYFEVETAADTTRAVALAETHQPDLVLMRGDGTYFPQLCETLRSGPVPDAPLLAIGTTNAAAVLLAGADDVLPVGCGDEVIFARIRTALRDAANRQELIARLGLGAEEPTAQVAWDAPQRARIGFVTHRKAQALAWQAVLASSGLGRAEVLDPKTVLGRAAGSDRHDIYVIDHDLRHHGSSIALLNDLRARPHGRGAEAVLLLPDCQEATLAAAFDAGAGSVHLQSGAMAELAARLTALSRRKRQAEALQDALDAGLALARLDPLTGLQNRRAAMAQLTGLRDTRTALALCMIDIDHFKSINDTHGHATGDAVLVAVAHQLRRSLPAAPLLARFGGEEFLAALPADGPEHALAMANAMRRDVAGLKIASHSGAATVQLTLSAGIIMAERTRQSSELLADADAALYRAKRGGRNRVEPAFGLPAC